MHVHPEGTGRVHATNGVETQSVPETCWDAPIFGPGGMRVRVELKLLQLTGVVEAKPERNPAAKAAVGPLFIMVVNSVLSESTSFSHVHGFLNVQKFISQTAEGVGKPFSHELPCSM